MLIVGCPYAVTLSSNKVMSRHSSAIFPQIDEVEPLKSFEESEGQVINNRLPDEEELFSGIVDGMGHYVDDVEEYDVFTYSGGIELDAEEHLQAGRRNVAYPWGVHQNQQRSGLHVQDHGPRIHSNARLSNSALMGDASPHENSRIFNAFPSSVRMSSAGNEFGRSPNLHPHSPQVQMHGVNVIPQNSLDNLTGFADDFRPRELADGGTTRAILFLNTLFLYVCRTRCFYMGGIQ